MNLGEILNVANIDTIAVVVWNKTKPFDDPVASFVLKRLSNGKYGETAYDDCEVAQLIVAIDSELRVDCINSKEQDMDGEKIIDQWEYKVEYLAHRGGDQTTDFSPGVPSRLMWELDLEKQLNELGAAGWEVVDFPSDILDGRHVDGWALFKRKKNKE